MSAQKENEKVEISIVEINPSEPLEVAKSLILAESELRHDQIDMCFSVGTEKDFNKLDYLLRQGLVYNILLIQRRGRDEPIKSQFSLNRIHYTEPKELGLSRFL